MGKRVQKLAVDFHAPPKEVREVNVEIRPAPKVIREVNAEIRPAPKDYPSPWQVQLAERESRRSLDILERLKEQAPRQSDLERRDDLIDAIKEIEWLRGSRPSDAPTRQELDAMAEQLRQMQSMLASMMELVERGSK